MDAEEDLGQNRNDDGDDMEVNDDIESDSESIGKFMKEGICALNTTGGHPPGEGRAKFPLQIPLKCLAFYTGT